jgi:hypothetical protein
MPEFFLFSFGLRQLRGLYVNIYLISEYVKIYLTYVKIYLISEQ